jgi:hypothetical protein
VKRLREVLADSAERPTFIETLTRRGYRFIVPVERSPAETSRIGATGRLFQRLIPKKKWSGPAITLLAIVCVIGFWRVSQRKVGSPLPPIEAVPVAVYHGDALQPALSPDGDRIVFVAGEDRDFGIYTALVGGEKSVRLTHNPGTCFPSGPQTVSRSHSTVSRTKALVFIPFRL